MEGTSEKRAKEDRTANNEPNSKSIARTFDGYVTFWRDIDRA